MKYLSSLLAVALMSGSVSCQQAVPAPASPFTTSFQLLNERGQPAASFPQGQNIIFRFQLINHSDQAVHFAAPLFDTRQFLEVTTRGGISFGKPYTGVLCTTIGAYQVAAHDTMTFSIPWVAAAAYPTSSRFCGHAATTYLPVERYRTCFAPSFTWHQDINSTTAGPTHTTNAQELSQEFEVTGPGGK